METCGTLYSFGRQRSRKGAAFDVVGEWLLAFALFDMCHENMRRQGTRVTTSEIHVGALAARINETLQFHGEDIRLAARKVGAILKSLGLHTQLLNRSGRGLTFTSALKLKIHHLARQLGIDRRTIAYSGGLEAGYGGLPCALCDQVNLGAGLRFVNDEKLPKRMQGPLKRARLFEKQDVIPSENYIAGQHMGSVPEPVEK